MVVEGDAGAAYSGSAVGREIPLSARIVAIADVYDALTSRRVYKDAWTPLETVSAMWSWEGHFDRDVLFTFMRSIGVFPPGLLVQLRSNRLAIVLESKRRQPVPRVLAFYATRDREFITPEELTLDDTMALDGIVALADPGDWGFDDWDGLAERIHIRCFVIDPSIKSSLSFLRKTPWARDKVETAYRFMLNNRRKR